ncbi:MAG TPA: hypothetical protein VMF57_06130 [Solirubrobacteraceae bacterium]|nr:hypothetical protein [Solirubrobacteraceae bacterium]
MANTTRSRGLSEVERGLIVDQVLSAIRRRRSERLRQFVKAAYRAAMVVLSIAGTLVGIAVGLHALGLI